jgi:hypothetical protein
MGRKYRVFVYIESSYNKAMRQSFPLPLQYPFSFPLSGMTWLGQPRHGNRGVVLPTRLLLFARSPFVGDDAMAGIGARRVATTPWHAGLARLGISM